MYLELGTERKVQFRRVLTNISVDNDRKNELGDLSNYVFGFYNEVAQRLHASSPGLGELVAASYNRYR